MLRFRFLKGLFFFAGLLFIYSKAFAYLETYNPHTGRLDKIGIDASADVAIPCDAGKILKSSTPGTWVCDDDAGASSGAPTDAQYIVSATNATLTAEDLLTPGTAIDTSNESGIARVSWDSTEIGNTTFGDGTAAEFRHDYNLSAGDHEDTFKNGARNLSGNVTVSGDLTVGATNGATSVKFTGDGDGAVTLLGQGNGFDEDLTLNFDDTTNEVTASSSTGVSVLNLSGLNLRVSNDLTIAGDDLFMATNTDRLALIADGNNFNPEAIDLGTDTGGNYVASVATTSPLTGGAAGSEGAALTIAIPAAQAGVNGYMPGVSMISIDVLVAKSHDAVTLAGENYLSLSGQQITAGTVNDTNLTSEDFGDFTCDSGEDGCLIDANAVALGTDTTENYVATVSGGNAILVTGSGSETAAVTVSWDTLTVSQDALSAVVSSPSGFQTISGRATLIQGCADGSPLEWNETSDIWQCGTDSGGTDLSGEPLITQANSANLSAERALAGGEAIFLIDGGANSSMTVSFDRLTVSQDALSVNTVSPSGTEIVGDRFSLLQGCSNSQVLQWDETNDVWKCATGSGSDTDTYAVNCSDDAGISADRYIGCGGGDGGAANATESNIDQYITPVSGTAQNLDCTVATAPGVGESWTFTLRENAGDTSLTCQISGTSTTCEDDVNTDAIADSARIDVFADEASNSAASGDVSCSILIKKV